MTTPAPSPYPGGIDPRHVAVISLAARSRDGSSSVLHRHDGTVQVFLGTQADARAVESALDRVGYHVTRPRGVSDGRDVLVHGWSTVRLRDYQARLRLAAEYLAYNPDITAMATLDRLGYIPASRLASRLDRKGLLAAAGQDLRDWAAARCGTIAPRDPRAVPADPAAAASLQAAATAEDTLTELAADQLRVTEDALDRYPALRAAASHEHARDTAIAQALAGDTAAPPAVAGTAQLAGPAPGLPGRLAAEFPAAPHAAQAQPRPETATPNRSRGRHRLRRPGRNRRRS